MNTNSNATTAIETLAPENAIALFSQGKDAWNQWVEANPVFHVNFQKVDFQRLRNSDGIVNFSGFIFPNGNINFQHARFGDGDVSFYQVKFGKGNVNFRKVNFGKGEVRFIGTKFGEGSVNFSEAAFGGDKVDFQQASFDKGNVDFYAAVFGTNVDFSHTTFGDGDIRFTEATFGNGDVLFNKANFGEGGVDFQNASFGEGNVSFEYCQIKARFDFSQLTEPAAITALSFSGSSFESALTIANNRFTCVPDLTNTKTTHQVALDNFRCDYQQQKTANASHGFHWLKRQVAADSNDKHRLRRLKELAEANQHHWQALALFALEKRAARWQNGQRMLDSLLDWLYDSSSNYGRAILRPSGILVGSWILFAMLYGALAPAAKPHDSLLLILFAIVNSVPVLTFGKEARTWIMDSIFCDQTSLVWVYLVMAVQGVLSLALISLIVLGLRNRFRL